MLTMKDDFKILTFVSFCKQCFLVFIRKRHQQNGQGASNKQEYESPVPACHFGYIAEMAGWDWTFILLLIACALSILLMSFTYKDEKALLAERNKR